MAYFRIEFMLSGRSETLLGVLSDDDGEAYFCVDNVARFVKKKTWLKCHPIREILLDPKPPLNMTMMALADVLDVLKYPKTPRSHYVYNLLEYGHVRDLPYANGCHRITPCEEHEGIQFPTWLCIFKKDYGPKKNTSS